MQRADLHVRTCLLSFLPRELRHVRVMSTTNGSGLPYEAHMTPGRSLSEFRSMPSRRWKSIK
jgi:hypothetical protein